MILKAFCVYDSAVQAYLPPFFAQSVGGAVRSFADAVADEGHQFNKHAGDFTLFGVGEFDDSTGIFTPSPVSHVNLGCAIEYTSKRNSVPVVESVESSLEAARDAVRPKRSGC